MKKQKHISDTVGKKKNYKKNIAFSNKRLESSEFISKTDDNLKRKDITPHSKVDSEENRKIYTNNISYNPFSKQFSKNSLKKKHSTATHYLGTKSNMLDSQELPSTKIEMVQSNEHVGDAPDSFEYFIVDNQVVPSNQIESSNQESIEGESEEEVPKIEISLNE
jgi:hypothetical protein